MSGSKDCIFCKIVNKQIPAKPVYEDDSFICINDIQPQAKRHLLVLPKEHIPSLDAAFPEGGSGNPARGEMVGRLMEVGTRIARQEGLLPAGFRAVINTNRDGGQTVDHLHLHILGGEALGGHFA